MNYKKILLIIEKYPEITQRKLALKLEVSLGKINSLIGELRDKGYIKYNNDIYEITDDGKKYLELIEEKKIRNAVILAAGGSKDFDFPNGFIKFEEKTLIERSVDILLSFGIEKIYIVTGFKKEYFHTAFSSKEEIYLIDNDDYSVSSSFTSFMKIKEIIKEDFLLLDSDIIYESKAVREILKCEDENVILISNETGSKDEAYVESENGYLKKLSKDIHEIKSISGEMLGISKISYKAFEEIINLNVLNPYYSYEYSISDICKKIKIKCLKINELAWGEVDNKEQLSFVEKNLFPRIRKNESLREISKIEDLIIDTLQIKKMDIDNIDVLGGMTNKNYLVTINSKKYVLRVPGVGTDSIIDRVAEKNNATLASEIGIDNKMFYFCGDTGIKIAEYINNAETLNFETAKKLENLKLTANLLRKLHNSNLKYTNKFDVFQEINKYEQLIGNIQEIESKYENYQNIKKEILKLKRILKKNGSYFTSCHNDTVPENFIKNLDRIYLIDWEYSGLNDPMWDLAAHSLECQFDSEIERNFLTSYFKRDEKLNERIRFEAYKILQDFLWSIWTILKEMKGDDFGDYGIERYKRAVRGLKELKKYEV